MTISSRKIGFLAIPLLVIVIAAISAQLTSADGKGNPPSQGIDNNSCFACHASPDLTTTLPSGETLYLTIDKDTFNQSIHGELGYACVQCHTDITSFPHAEIPTESLRDLSLELYTSCARCHPDMYESTLDSVHAKALAAGHPEAAVCTDCHGAHDITSPHEPRSKIPQTCQLCHSEIYKRYEESVHGSALIGDGNPDVPSCVDCHGVHDVEGPSSGSFHLFSPQICAECHTDPELMEKYGVSTDVLDTYVADFHGTTVKIFEETAPDQETNKPVCVDCHGVHDILPTDDPDSKVIQENLLTTCQRCHPDATTNFPNAWLKHYDPSPEKAPMVFFVDLFYDIFIPVMIGGMLLFVVIDGSRRIINKRKERNHE
ncbi:MAG: cytochrome C [Anaerolineales bacterium]|nr:cytochrome C [Anaerolineales bacterium]